MKTLTHSQVRLLIEKAADGLLTASEQRALESHLQGCAECRAFANEFSALEAALGAALTEHLGQPELSAGAEHTMVAQIQEAIGVKGGSGGSGKAGGGGGGGGGIKILGGLGPWIALLLVIGAIVGLGSLEFRSAAPMQLTAELVFDPFESLTPSPTPSRTATMTVTSTITPTPSPSVFVLTAIPQQNVNCRLGNSSAFDIADTLFEGIEYSPIARGPDNLWVQFRGPVTNVKCWVFVDNLDLLINGQITPIEEIPESLLPYVNYPPTPTPTFTLTFTPEPEEPSDTPPPPSAQPQCSDGKDNDQDGAIDYPRDKDCKSQTDNNEFD